MLSSRYGLKLQFIVLTLFAIFLCESCATTEPHTSATESNKNLELSTRQLSVTAQQIGDSSVDKTVSNRQAVSDEKITLPYQARARRKNIKLPDDCHYFANTSVNNWRLQLACAESLDAVLPNLPKDGCQYEAVQKAGGRFIEVVQDARMLTHTVQETDVGNLENLAEKLGTTSDNIIVHNKFDDSGKLLIGQELKYQKSRSEKSAASWFDDYDIAFYALSPNKYLVKIRCLLGAYNELNAYLLYDESAIPAKTEVLEFPSFAFTYDEDSDVAKTVEKITVKTIGGRWFNPKTKQLIVFVKARGIGDAGHYARYSFSRDKPQLEEYRAKFKWSGIKYTPDEIQKRPPQTWKRYYP